MAAARAAKKTALDSPPIRQQVSAALPSHDTGDHHTIMGDPG